MAKAALKILKLRMHRFALNPTLCIPQHIASAKGQTILKA